MSLAQVVAILRAIEERLDDPDGRIQQAASDAFRSHFLITQMSAVMTQQRDQIQALSDALGVLVGRFIEHDKRISSQHAELLDLFNALARGVGEQEIAALASDAKARLDAAEQERLAEIALSADAAKELLRKARLDARSLISRALNQAEAELSDATEVAKRIVTAAAETAHDKLSEDSEETE